MTDGGIYADDHALIEVTARLSAAASRLKQAGRTFSDTVYVPGTPGDSYTETLRSWLEPSIEGVGSTGTGLGGTMLDVSDAIDATRMAYKTANQAAGM